MSDKKTADILASGILEVLKTKKQRKLLPEVSEILRRHNAEKRNEERILVWSVIPLPPHNLSRIRLILEEKFGRKLEVENKLDKSLIGGFKIELGDWVFEASLASEFVNLEKLVLS